MPKKLKREQLAELVALRTLQEQRWAADRRLEHLSYRAMRERAARPESAGGLGRDLSEHRLKRLVEDYRERMAGVEVVELAEHRERELHDLDMVQRYALAAMEKAASASAFDEKAVDKFLKAGAERRKLLGLDMPVVAKVEVVHKDAVTVELNEMLARAGRKPM